MITTPPEPVSSVPVAVWAYGGVGLIVLALLLLVVLGALKREVGASSYLGACGLVLLGVASLTASVVGWAVIGSVLGVIVVIAICLVWFAL